jgi:hypothetical protein
MKHANFLEHGRYRYFKAALLLCALAIGAYGWHRGSHFNMPGAIGYGGSPMGYGLGSVAAALVLWLLWLGVRKRRYGESRTTLRGWLSAHVYLGVAVLVVATLHAGFEVGWNIHTLALALLIVVVLSGLYGVVLYLRVPPRLTQAMGEDSVDSLLLQIREIDQQARQLAMQMPDAVSGLVGAAIDGTRLSGTPLAHVLGSVGRGCPTALAVAGLQGLVGQLRDDQARVGHQLFGLMLARRSAVERVRREYWGLAHLRLWLQVHVPASLALLAALVAHVVAVFAYW